MLDSFQRGQEYMEIINFVKLRELSFKGLEAGSYIVHSFLTVTLKFDDLA